MSDPCMLCCNVDDVDACEAVECDLHDNWYVKQLKEDLAEKQSLFNLQHKRTLEAMAVWQKETGNDCWPDLGELVRWLMEKAERNKQMEESMTKLADEWDQYNRSFPYSKCTDELRALLSQ